MISDLDYFPERSNALHLSREESLMLINLLTKASWTGVHEDCQLCKKVLRFLRPIEQNYNSDLLLLITVI